MIDKNDPKLTAFALGELSAQEHAEIAEAIELSPELQREVDEIRATASLLETGFAAEVEREKPVASMKANGNRDSKPAFGKASSPRKRLWWILAVTAASIALLIGGFYFVEIRQQAAQATAAAQLKQLDLGNSDYHDTFKSLPPGTIADEELDAALFGEATDQMPGYSDFESDITAIELDSIFIATGAEFTDSGGEGTIRQFPANLSLIVDNSTSVSGGELAPEGTVITSVIPVVQDAAPSRPQVADAVEALSSDPSTQKAAVEAAKPGDREEGRIARSGKDDAKAKPKSWKRVKAIPNTSRLMIGDKDELAMQGMQVKVKVDGFRARVMLDCMYYNDRDQQLEGSFKLRLPNDASLFYFAFGESAYQYTPDLEPKDLQQELIKNEFDRKSRVKAKDDDANEIEQVSLSLVDIRADREDAWDKVKEARVVPREKAAFAYGQTVRRKVDPALVEWAGAGVFNAKVFPLAPKKMHRIVIGYDVNLQLVDGKLVYRLELPEEAGASQVDVDFAMIGTDEAKDDQDYQESVQISTTAGIEPTIRNGRMHYHVHMPEESRLEFSFDAPQNVLLVSGDGAADQFFATRFSPELPSEEVAGSSQALFLVDTSLSSNPEQFNVWLDMLRATLDGNRDSMQQFAVLFFDVDSHWWNERFVENSPANVDKLIAYCETLSLEGATDLHAAFHRVASADWIENAAKPDLFLLSDAAATWGEMNLAMINHQLDSANIGSLFAYQSGMTGTDSRALNLLARKHGGAVFNVTTEAEIAEAATAHLKRPWQLKSIETEDGSDLMTAGRVESVYPGQSLLIVGRGHAGDEIVLELELGDEKKTIRMPIQQRIESELAERVYGQIAVGQLESLGRYTEEVSVAYARHFRVPGQTCSLLMLESEEDYERFNIKPEDDRFVVNSSKASSLIEKKLATVRQQLGDPKLEMISWLERLEKAESLKFKLPTALRIAIDDVPTSAFEVSAFLPESKMRLRPDDKSFDIVELAGSYDEIQKLASKRREQFGTIDALRTLSNLVERSPGNPVLLRDIAFTAIEWEHPEAAYHLLRRVALARPYEGHVYTALGQCLANLEHTELAIVFYEVAINGQFPQGGNDFRQIATVEYVSMLKDIVEGRRMTAIPEYASSRYESLKSSVGFETADLVVSMMWNTDRNDVDLHVVEPGGEECYYEHRDTKMGGHMTQDVTTGFGPEMYVVKKAKPGTFTIKSKYYGGDALRSGVRAKVLLTIYENFGTENQTEHRETITLEKTGEVVEVAKVKIAQSASAK